LSLSERVRKAKKVLILGNGGSYSNSGHLVNDLLACGIRAFTIDPATLSAFANDYGWYQALARWVRIVGDKEDLLIALSGSGKSPNILAACEAAEKIGMDVWKEFGAERGLDIQRAEEKQIEIGHELRAALLAHRRRLKGQLK
jgi:D-sedoheptulose 7-phosphate isomerase